MYAVLKTGGKQYRVQAGESVRVEALPAEVGAAVSFDEVLMVGEGEKRARRNALPRGRQGERDRRFRMGAAKRCASSRCAGASIP
jgi:hypothetical protein